MDFIDPSGARAVSSYHFWNDELVRGCSNAKMPGHRREFSGCLENMMRGSDKQQERAAIGVPPFRDGPHHNCQISAITCILKFPILQTVVAPHPVPRRKRSSLIVYR